jgi:hypothetical protein
VRSAWPFLVLACAGCGARTGLDAGHGVGAVCGDGIVQAGEECDTGGALGAICPVFLVTQRGETREVTPVARSRAALGFYSYTSKSAHTGFETLGGSRIFLYRDTESDALSLFTLHGIDFESSGIAQPESKVTQRLTGLPDGIFVALTDDYDSEISMQSATAALGTWGFNQNTDGAILSGIPAGKEFAIGVASDFQLGVDAWAYVDADGTMIELALTESVTIERRFEPCDCKSDCTR